jgi:hypothetical protein
MDFGLFVHHSSTPTVMASPSPTPTVPGYDFNLSFLESKFFWWFIKLLFWSTIIRDACFNLVPFIGRLIKSAIDKSIPLPDTDVSEDAAELPEPATETRSRVKGGAYHYSSALESALGLKEGDVEMEIRKGIDVLGDKAEEVVEGLAGSMLESLMGGERQHKE